VLDFRGRWQVKDERKIRFEMIHPEHGSFWCNSTDFMETVHLEYDRWAVNIENCTVLENIAGYY